MKHTPLSFTRPSFGLLSQKEWLVTNGIGGYASSSLAGAHTRRYHGLLVAALNPPSQRTVVVSKVEETILHPDGTRTALSSNQYPGVVHPEGYAYLTRFDRTPIPRFTYQAHGITLEKSVCMVHGKNATILRYRNPSGKESLTLSLQPFYVHRDYHSLQHDSAEYYFRTQWDSDRRGAIYARDGAPPVFFSFTKGTFDEHPDWYRNFQYQKESDRGLDNQEDCFTPGALTVELEPGESFYLTFSMDPAVPEADPAALMKEEVRRVKAIRQAPAVREVAERISALSGKGEDLGAFFLDLVTSGDQFIVDRPAAGGHSLIAGYHWFTDWGRDTMIAMRGLIISTGKKTLAESILRTFLKYVDQGMLPNRFPDQGEIPEYNTIDATLWLFVVLHEYYLAFEDLAFIASVFPKLTEILDAHRAGTRYQIRMTDEGLLSGGEGLSQLTWMDARIGDHVVTPRQGCAVEIQALWYNALQIYRNFAHLLDQQIHVYATLPEQVQSQFLKFFDNGNGLYDVVIPGSYSDDTIRPNQIYALSLPFPLVEGQTAEQILRVVKNQLFTPMGLRSLDPAHPDFRGHYGGDQWQRDTAYHQGTVWAFLLGEYLLAEMRFGRQRKALASTLPAQLQPIIAHFYTTDCIHGISEIFDGTDPSTGRGCIHQAWSIGMLIKALTDLANLNTKTPGR